jgi:hypothetical protein
MSTVQGGQGNIVTNGLVLNLDAANPRSYPQPYNGTTWQNLVAVSSSISGSLVNGVGYTGSNGGALVFDGVNDNVVLDRVVQDSFSLCCWFLTTQSYSYQGSNTKQWYYGAGLVDAEVANVVNDFGMTLQFGKVDFGIGNPDVTLQSPLAYNDNIWHYAVGTRDRTTGVINLYVDAGLKDTGVGNTNSLIAPSKIKIGSLQPDLSFYSGNIASTQIYNRALSASEVLQNFNATRARFGV